MGDFHCIILISIRRANNGRNSLGYKVPTLVCLSQRQAVSYMSTCIVKTPSLLGQRWYFPPRSRHNARVREYQSTRGRLAQSPKMRYPSRAMLYTGTEKKNLRHLDGLVTQSSLRNPGREGEKRQGSSHVNRRERTGGLAGAGLAA